MKHVLSDATRPEPQPRDSALGHSGTPRGRRGDANPDAASRDVSREAVTYDWDVAVSFAGEDRAYVEDLVRRLQDRDIKVFYDQDHLAAMWGENLVDFLQAVYKRRARYAILFVSHNYLVKKWTDHERQSVQDRALQQSSTYILPIRLDDTELPGLHSSIVYLDARRIGIDDVVNAIMQKLGSRSESSPPLLDNKVPRTADGIAPLLTSRPPGWQYLLYAGVLRQGIDSLDDKYRDHLIGYARRSTAYLSDDDASRILNNQIGTVEAIMESLMRVLDLEAQHAALGYPGEGGQPDRPPDADRTIHLARRLVSVYEELLDWAAGLRSLNISDEHLRRVADIQAHWVDQPLVAIRELATNFTSEADTFVERLQAGEQIRLTMGVTFELSKHLTKSRNSEFSAWLKSRR